MLDEWGIRSMQTKGQNRRKRQLRGPFLPPRFKEAAHFLYKFLLSPCNLPSKNRIELTAIPVRVAILRSNVFFPSTIAQPSMRPTELGVKTLPR